MSSENVEEEEFPFPPSFDVFQPLSCTPEESSDSSGVLTIVEDDDYLEEEEIEEVEMGNELWQSLLRKYKIQKENAKNNKPKTLKAEVSYPREQQVRFIKEKVFPVILPLLEKTLREAVAKGALKGKKSTFNPMDHMVELLWNSDPDHPEREGQHCPFFEIPDVQEYLKENPRPPYPLSCLLTEDEAALMIQCQVRGWLVRKTPEVTELRQFWKTLKEEHLQKENGSARLNGGKDTNGEEEGSNQTGATAD